MLEAREQRYVLSVRSNERLMTVADGATTREACAIADALPASAWHRYAAGEGAKGPRLYDWARVRLLRLQTPHWDHWLLIRRSLREPSERAYYVVFALVETTLSELAGVAGLRWTIETCFGTAKGELGLDHCEARSWDGWHRHMSLVMAAAAFLARLAADLRRSTWAMADPPTAKTGKANERSPRAKALA